MFYEFPHITHINDVLPAIEGEDAFIVAARDYGTVINYRQMGTDVFPPVRTAGGSPRMRAEATRAKAIRRECRGLIFNQEGVLISRPYQKFFNVGERDETLVEKIPFDQPHVILEKLDGSMIRPVTMPNGQVLMGTKMAITPVAAQVDPWVAKNENYMRFMQDVMQQGYTPIFEWCSRQQTIVIDHPEDRLVLTAVRDVRKGDYMTYTMLQDLALDYRLDLVRQFEGSVDSMQWLMDHTRDLKGAEGYVLRWMNGHMAKIKAEEYCEIHRAKEGILRENGVITMMLDEKLDDVLPHLPQADRIKLENFQMEFWLGVRNTQLQWQAEYLQVRREFGHDRKAFALNKAAGLEQYLRGAIFKAWDDADFDWQAAVLDAVSRNLGTGVKTNAVRYLWGDARWSINSVGDE